MRESGAVDILHKVVAAESGQFEELVSGDTPFGLATNFAGYARRRGTQEWVKVRSMPNAGTTRVRSAVAREAINKNTHLIEVWKLLLPKAGSGRERREAAWTWC